MIKLKTLKIALLAIDNLYDFILNTGWGPKPSREEIKNSHWNKCFSPGLEEKLDAYLELRDEIEMLKKGKTQFSHLVVDKTKHSIINE